MQPELHAEVYKVKEDKGQEVDACKDSMAVVPKCKLEEAYEVFKGQVRRAGCRWWYGCPNPAVTSDCLLC